MPVVNTCSYLRKLVNTFFLSESATGSVSVEGLVSSPRVVGGQKVLKGMFYLWHQRAWRQTASTKQIRSAWRTSGLWPLNKQIDIDPRTPPPQNAGRSSHSLWPPHPPSQQPCRAYCASEKALEKALAEKAQLKSKLKGVQAAEQTIRAARGASTRGHFSDALVPGKSWRRNLLS